MIRLFATSMRPPLNAGENAAARLRVGPAPLTSMRPPLNAGENSRRRAAARSRRLHFNEAPAERGGKPVAAARAAHPRPTSMRPPLNAGENCQWTRRTATPPSDFNEAPAERGGKLPSSPSPESWTRSNFNEAPAERGGKRDHRGGVRGDGHTSMRPPLNAGENIEPVLERALIDQTSMRPPLNAGENARSGRISGGATSSLQ